MKKINPLFIAAFIALNAISFKSAAQCDGSFTYTGVSNTQYHFVANQVQQTGLTYYDYWNFGNGGTAYTAVTDYDFYQTGTYNVCHTITIQDSLAHVICTDSQCQVIQINITPPCLPYFYAYLSYPGALTVSFSNSIADYTNLSIWWTFGDGNSQSGVASPTYTYSAYGTYLACFHVTDTVHHCSDSSCVSVQLNACNLHCYFGANQLSYNYPVLNFSDGSYGNYQFTHWDFGDGTVSDTAISSHTFLNFGTYLVCLTHRDTVLGCADSSCAWLLVDTCLTVAPISFYSNYGPLQVELFATTNYYNNVYYTWNFGDGTIDSAGVSGGIVTHTYADTGTYRACYTMTAPGCASLSRCDSVVVQCNIAPGFSWSQQGVYVSFSANQSGLADSSYQWNFGDGTSGSAATTYHYYPTTGTYIACLTVHSSGCPSLTACDTVVILCSLNASLTNSQISTNTIEYFASSSSAYTTFSWNFGDGHQGTGQFPIHVYADSGTYNACLIVHDTVFNCSDTICQLVNAQLWNDTICGHVFADLNGNGIQDSLEPPLQGFTVVCNDGLTNLQFTTDSNGYYTGLVPANVQLDLSLNYGAFQRLTLPFNFTTYYTYYFTFDSASHSQCGFDFGLMDSVCTISGTVYDDNNGNGIQDAGEWGISNQVIKLNGQGVVTANGGSYTAIVPANTYTLWKDSSGYFNHFGTLPAQIQLNATGIGSIYGNNNLGIEIPLGWQDLAVDLIPAQPIIPTSSAFYWEIGEPRYQLLVANLCNNYSTATAAIVADPALSFDVLNYSYTVDIPASNLTAWSQSLYPFQLLSTPAGFNLSPSAVINQDIYNTASVNLTSGTDSFPANNYDTCHQIVVMSFDPNDKFASEAGIGPQGFIRNDQVLKYVIDFQNTGNYYAVNIVVKDVLDANLDLESFRFIASSSACDVRLVGNTLYFRFSEIMLPDSARTQPGSHGWLAFAIKPKPGLAPLTPITNQAAIYFDHNAPIVTNSTLHTIQDNQVTDIPKTDDGVLRIMPNPFTEQTTIVLNNMPEPKYEYRISDMLGREVKRGEIFTDTPLTVSHRELSAGAYVVSLYNNQGIFKRAKIVAE